MTIFHDHVELLHFFLSHRASIVDRIQGVLNAQRKPLEYLRNASQLSLHIEDCFFSLPEISAGQSRLRGRLLEAHWADGFRPRRIPGLSNGLVDPAEMTMRAFHLWRETRWPGRQGRVRYAHTLFNLYVLRCLVMLSIRLWDDEGASPAARLAQMQRALDLLCEGAPADQPALVRDARWLIPLAQSPATDDLGAYFAIAQKVTATLSPDDRLEIHRASVCMAGGHLRSQVRYHSTKTSTSLDVESLIRSTRETNALDFALLIQDLVPLLAAYEQAWQANDERSRIALADVICQGLSPDPEMLLNQVDLLGAYSMLEHLFITTDANGRTAYTAMGRRHVDLFHEYRACISRVAGPLSEDAPRFRPVTGTYSPYGVLFGFSTNLVEHMAFKAVQADAVTHFSLEDVFAAGEPDKLAWVNGWRQLPHLPREVQAQFEYPQQFAEATFERIARAFRSHPSDVARPGRLFVVRDGETLADPDTPTVPEVETAYRRSSDARVVAAHTAEAQDETQLLRDRGEGKFLVSYQTPGGWTAIRKAVLTDVLGAGRDAMIRGLPAPAAGALTLLCPGLVATALNEEAPPASCAHPVGSSGSPPE